MNSGGTLVTAALVAAGMAISASASSTSLPAVKTQGNARYVSGGIGTEEARAMQKLAGKYPLELEFVLRASKGARGEYTADVPVTIRDARGSIVLDVRSEGPILLVNLPAGAYVVSAEQDGRIERRHVNVTARHKRVVFEWLG